MNDFAAVVGAVAVLVFATWIDKRVDELEKRPLLPSVSWVCDMAPVDGQRVVVTDCRQLP